jgi:hypothetical protein
VFRKSFVILMFGIAVIMKSAELAQPPLGRLPHPGWDGPPRFAGPRFAGPVPIPSQVTVTL